MSTCLDDLNETLDAIRDAIASLAVTQTWLTWTPIPEQGNPALDIDLRLSQYAVIHGVAYVDADFSMTINGVSGEVVVCGGLPVMPVLPTDSAPALLGTAVILTGGIHYGAIPFTLDGVEIGFYYGAAGNVIGPNPLVELGNGDLMRIHLQYRAAS